LADNPEDDFVSYEPPPEGAYRELGIGALQGATTDLGGSFADIGAAATGIASQIDPRLLRTSPIASALSAADPYAQAFVKRFGSEALGSRFFPPAPEDLEAYRDLGRLTGGITGAGELITARGAKAVSSGIQDFMQYLPNVRPQAVTPDGRLIPVPDDGLPDTSVTEMLASADTPGINPQWVRGIKYKESEAQKRLEDGEDPRKVFEETGFMRINVDARPGRGPDFMDSDDSPLETKMVFDIPDNLSQIKISNILPESVETKVSAGKSGAEVMDSFENLKDPKNFFVERGHRGGKYGRSVQFKLKDVMGEDHPLFDVFPDLKDDIDVRIIEKPSKGSGGHWDDSTNTIAIGAEYLGNDRYTSTLMVHEIAHVLQTRGDLPRGSSPFLVKESVSGKLFDNFALFQTTEALAERGNRDFNPYEFFNELRPKGEAKNVESLVNQARLNVKNANPDAPDNLARMWPGNTNSTARINLDEMPYRDEVLAEMYRLIGEKEAKAFKEAEAYQALGIDIYREKDAAGSLKQGPSAMGNYMKTRGEFMARLQEGYALATEGMPVSERRKLFPMDVAIKGARATEAAPGGDTGAALEYVKEIQPGTGVMRGTQKMDYPAYLAEIREKEALIASNPEFPLRTRFGLFDDMKELEFSLEMAKEGEASVIIPKGRPGINVGTVPPSEMGLVDVEGLINVDKIPDNLKNKIEYPQKGPAPASAPKSTGLLGGDKPQRFYHGTGAEFKEFNPDAPYTFVADSPATSDFYAIDGDSPNTRPVYLKDVNFFDVDNPNHLEQLLESDWYQQHGKSLERNFGEYDRTFLDLVESGNYEAIEESGLPDWIKAQGFDGFTTYEQAGKNYAVFDVNNIVPGVVKKKEGGVITLADVARNMNRGPRGVAALAPIARNMNRPMVS